MNKTGIKSNAKIFPICNYKQHDFEGQRFYRKNGKYHSSVFINIMGNTFIMGLMIGSSN